MKIDVNTVSVLKNFAKINSSIIVPEGNVLKNISPGKTIMARATVTTEFTKRFAIYNLDRFLSAISMYNEPDLEFGETSVTLREGNSSTSLLYASEDTIVKAPEKTLTLPSVDVSFNLSYNNLKEVEKALGVLSLPEIVVVGNGSEIFLQAADSKSPSDVYSIFIGNTDKKFKAVFKSENIRTLPVDFKVDICSKGISHFQGESVEYWIAVESNSTFGE